MSLLEPDRVSKELAFKLKELGLIFEGDYYWELSGNDPWSDLKWSDWNEYSDRSNAPLMSEVQRWIRKNKSYDVLIRKVWIYKDTYSFDILKPNWENDELDFYQETSIKGTSYEEALDRGLLYYFNNFYTP